MMGLPSVVVGVIVYLILSRSGPFGGMGLLYSPVAMVMAQTVLVVPLIAALTRQIVEDAWRTYATEFHSMHFSLRNSVAALLYDCRYSLVVAVLAGTGRSLSEVGAVMIVGGNIEGYTRVMTTAIALETAKGDLPLSLALGMVLLTVVLLLNTAAYHLRSWAMRKYG
jgi:tungstate transport system permease protein